MKKTLLTLIVTLFTLFCFAQKKDNSGRYFTIEVNGDMCRVREYDIDSEYIRHIKSLGSYAKNIDEWNKDWAKLKSNMIKCEEGNTPFQFQVAARQVLSLTVDCDILTDEERGYGKKKRITRRSLRGDKGRGNRFGILYSMLGRFVAASFDEYLNK